jgi:hypothetical protein
VKVRCRAFFDVRTLCPIGSCVSQNIGLRKNLGGVSTYQIRVVIFTRYPPPKRYSHGTWSALALQLANIHLALQRSSVRSDQSFQDWFERLLANVNESTVRAKTSIGT